MTKHALVLSPLRESPRHLSQNFSSSFSKDEGFLPFKEAPGISFSVRIMLLSADEELDDAMISLLFTLPRPFRPRFHVLDSRPFRAAAIYEYGVLPQKLVTEKVKDTLLVSSALCLNGFVIIRNPKNITRNNLILAV